MFQRDRRVPEATSQESDCFGEKSRSFAESKAQLNSRLTKRELDAIVQAVLESDDLLGVNSLVALLTSLHVTSNVEDIRHAASDCHLGETTYFGVDNTCKVVSLLKQRHCAADFSGLVCLKDMLEAAEEDWIGPQEKFDREADLPVKVVALTPQNGVIPTEGGALQSEKPPTSPPSVGVAPEPQPAVSSTAPASRETPSMTCFKPILVRRSWVSCLLLQRFNITLPGDPAEEEDTVTAEELFLELEDLQLKAAKAEADEANNDTSKATSGGVRGAHMRFSLGDGETGRMPLARRLSQSIQRLATLRRAFSKTYRTLDMANSVAERGHHPAALPNIGVTIRPDSTAQTSFIELIRGIAEGNVISSDVDEADDASLASSEADRRTPHSRAPGRERKGAAFSRIQKELTRQHLSRERKALEDKEASIIETKEAELRKMKRIREMQASFSNASVFDLSATPLSQLGRNVHSALSRVERKLLGGLAHRPDFYVARHGDTNIYSRGLQNHDFQAKRDGDTTGLRHSKQLSPVQFASQSVEGPRAAQKMREMCQCRCKAIENALKPKYRKDYQPTRAIYLKL